MPSKKVPYGTIRSLYGELEAARREYETEGELPWNRRGAGGQAYVLFLELLDIADWLGGASQPDEEDDEQDTLGLAEGQDDLPDALDGEGDIPRARSLDGREQAGVHQAAGVPSPVAADELVQQPLLGAVGRAVPGLTIHRGSRRKADLPVGQGQRKLKAPYGP